MNKQQPLSKLKKNAFAETLDTALATKTDTNAIRADVNLLRKDMEAMELRLTIKLGAFIAAAVGIIIAVLRMPI